MDVVAQCSTTKARAGKLSLPHHVVDTPVFMPVGTQGTLKGLTPKQLENIGIQIMLGNTYHLGKDLNNNYCTSVKPCSNQNKRCCVLVLGPQPGGKAGNLPFP